MSNKTKKVVLVCCAYGALAGAITANVIIGYALSHYPGSFHQLKLVIISGFIASIAASVFNIAVIVKYSNSLKVISILGVLVSIGMVVLLIPSLGFSLG